MIMASILYIEKNDVASAWIEAVRRVFLEGDDIETQYDREGDPPAKDSTVLITIREPFSNPMTVGTKNRELKLKSKHGNEWVVYGHKGDVVLAHEIRGGYIEMVLYGDEEYRKGKSYSYDYNDRLTNWTPYEKRDIRYKKYKAIIFKILRLLRIKRKLHNIEFPSINQISLIIEGLKKSPISRRIQAITWKPFVDPYNSESPCLQRLWFRVKDGKLISEASWRSRDLWSAWQSNVNAVMRIQEQIARELNVEIGEYIDFSNSLHIYGKDINKAKELLTQLSII
jgi:thymidylate synthase